MDFDYWQKQAPDKPLFPDIVWDKPEQKALAGKLLLVGGSSSGFAAVAQAYQDSIKAGIGECRAVLPDSLKKSIGAGTLDCVFVPTNQSGGMSKEGLPAIKAAAAWTDTILYIGDAGRNSETSIVYEQLLQAFPDKLNVITRDAADLVKADWPELLQQPKTIFIMTLAQLQKLFQAVYYPKTILFSMQLTNLVEALHKFTVTYPATIVVFHQDQMVVAQDGQVTSTPWLEPMMIWRGTVAARAAVYAAHQPNKILKAITTSLTKPNLS
jgi:NAD(P)H-hydrate repair Nnr-like enzyme with NAD(P)H-hydrate dehydratase domain